MVHPRHEVIDRFEVTSFEEPGRVTDIPSMASQGQAHRVIDDLHEIGVEFYAAAR